jgi:hypothetical protein
VPVHDNIYDNISTTNDEYCTGGLCGLLWRALVDEIGHGLPVYEQHPKKWQKSSCSR